jgi:hypothetical protein
MCCCQKVLHKGKLLTLSIEQQIHALLAAAGGSSKPRSSADVVAHVLKKLQADAQEPMFVAIKKMDSQPADRCLWPRRPLLTDFELCLN